MPDPDEEPQPRSLPPVSFVLPDSVSVPAPVVTVEPVVVPAPVVTVDTSAVAEAVDRMASGLAVVTESLDYIQRQVAPGRAEASEQEVIRDADGRIVEVVTRGTSGTRRRLVHREHGRIVRIEEIAV